ncbi:MAG: PilW family protein [Sideroxyarcus sp.]
MTSHIQFPLLRPARSTQSGFTLVELMVGIAIGMLATLVVMQVFTVFEAQKRTTTGTADAQTNGNIALYNVTRDMQAAGYALMPTGDPVVADSALECASVFNGVTAAASGVANLSPVSITNNGGGNGGDSITIRYGTSPMGGLQTKITAVVTAGVVDMPVESTLGCAVSDVALVINGATCALTSVTSTVPATKIISFYDDRAITAGAAALNAKVSCLGTWNTVTYTVDSVNGNLLRDGVPIVAGVVNMQAQYGIAAALPSNDPDFNKVVAWVDAAPPWDAPAVTDRNRIKAVRIAIIARNATREPRVVSKTCSSVVTAKPEGVCAWDATSASPSITSNAPVVDLSIGNPDWEHYRYKVFETIIPLRNVIWARRTL